MVRRAFSLTKKDVGILNSGIARAKNNPLGSRGSKTERRPQSDLSDIEYNGYFKTILSDTDKIKVVYGYDLDSAICGYATINDTVFAVNIDELTITADAFIYLQSIYDTGTEITGMPTIEQSASFPTYEANKFKKLLSNIVFVSPEIVDIIPQHGDGAIIGHTFGACT